MKKIIVVVMLLILVTGCGCKKKIDNKTTIKNNEATSDVKVEKITFTDIKFVYEGGITTLSGTIKNNTKEEKSFTATISLKDDDGKEVKKLQQIVEKLDKDSYQVLTTGIVGDYSKIKNVEFSVEYIGD